MTDLNYNIFIFSKKIFFFWKVDYYLFFIFNSSKIEVGIEKGKYRKCAE